MTSGGEKNNFCKLILRWRQNAFKETIKIIINKKDFKLIIVVNNIYEIVIKIHKFKQILVRIEIPQIFFSKTSNKRSQ